MHVVIFTGGVSPLPQNTTFFFARCPKVDYVIAADSGLDTLEAYSHFFGKTQDFSPDFLIGDMDSIKDRSLLEKYKYVKSEIYNHDKDWTDTELALMHARTIATNPDEDIVTLVGGTGGRIDHLLSIYDSFSESYSADIWLTQEQIVCVLKDKWTIKISNISVGDRISVSRLSNSYDKGSIKSEGLAWESYCFKKKGMPSLSNRIGDDFFAKKLPVTLTACDADFLIMLPYHAKTEHPVRDAEKKQIVPGVVN